jgi:murein L,D-transpeptidase YafK
MQSPFKKSQLQNSRVKIAYEEKESVVKTYFKEKGVPYAGFHLFIRAFKKDGELEFWARQKDSEAYIHLHTYAFCSSSGTLGPKRKEGDLQIPEGIYEINHFNPLSNFYLSLGINYPNASDKILGDAKHPGSSIYIHGNCVTIGCIPITDDKIKELYVLAVEAKNNGQQKIPVHIYPSKMDAGVVDRLIQVYKPDVSTISFWRNLQSIYSDFQITKQLKSVSVNAKGEYYF